MPRNKIIFTRKSGGTGNRLFFSFNFCANGLFSYAPRVFFAFTRGVAFIFPLFPPRLFILFYFTVFAFCQPFFITLFSFARSSDAYRKSVFVDKLSHAKFHSAFFCFICALFRSFNYYKVICSICGALLCFYKACFSYTLQHKIRIRRNTERKIAEYLFSFRGSQVINIVVR